MAFRKLITTLSDYFIFGCFFMAVIAVVMFLFTRSLFNLPVTLNFIPFIFFSTYASYSLHWYLTPQIKTFSQRAAWSLSHKKFLLAGFIVSVVGVIVSFIFVAEHYMLIIPLAAITFLYSAPKINSKPFTWLRGKYTAKTLSLTLVWLGVTVILPVAASGRAWGEEVLLFILNRFLLILPICILFDYRDRAEDRAEGIINLATFMNEKIMGVVIMACNIAAVVCAALLSFYTTSMDVLIVMFPSLLLTVTYKISYKRFDNTSSDLWYYGYLDGLMALSAIIYFLTGFVLVYVR